MKKFLFFFSLTVFAQQPICQIKDFSNSIKSISIGPYSTNVNRCNFWFNSPGAGQVQIACYEAGNPIPVDNQIKTPKNSLGSVGSWAFQNGQISWEIKVGEFHLVGAAQPDQIEVKEDGTF